MSFPDLTKDQKRYLAIGGIVAVVLGVLVFFGIRISLSSLRSARQELDELAGKIESADRSLARRTQTERELEEIAIRLGGLLENLPPERNYFSWATEVIYSAARDSGLEIDAIDELAGAEQGRKGKVAINTIQLEAYSLRITARGSFGNTKAFLAMLEQEQPLARITGVEIGSGSNPEIHDVQIFVQWPFSLNAITKAWEAIDAKRGSAEEGSPKKIQALEGPSKRSRGGEK